MVLKLILTMKISCSQLPVLTRIRIHCDAQRKGSQNQGAMLVLKSELKQCLQGIDLPTAKT